MCISTPNIPAPPPPVEPAPAATPPRQADAAVQKASNVARRRAIGGLQSTILTGAQGLTTAAPVGGKQLLGA